MIGVNGNGLVAAEHEAERVAAILEVEPMTGRVSSATALDRIREASLVHIASHAVLVPANPFESYFPLGGSERLPAWRVFREAPEADLITLSACDTAAPARRGIGVATERGPSSSFLSFAFAGNARFVLSSLWTASDELTADAMARFYTALRSSRNAVVALQEAKQPLIESGVHPHYFANLLLTARDVETAAAALGDH